MARLLDKDNGNHRFLFNHLQTLIRGDKQRNLPYLTGLLLLVLLIPGQAMGENETEDWYADIHIYQDKAHNKLTIGQNAKASDGPDRKWETPIPKTFMSGGVSSFFYHPEWKRSSPYYWRDIRSLGNLPRVWTFVVKTKKANVKVEMNWNLGRVRKDIQLFLKKKEDKEYFKLHKQRIFTHQSPVKETKFLLKAEQRRIQTP
jgi:hypothetical protein